MTTIILFAALKDGVSTAGIGVSLGLNKVARTDTKEKKIRPNRGSEGCDASPGRGALSGENPW